MAPRQVNDDPPPARPRRFGLGLERLDDARLAVRLAGVRLADCGRPGGTPSAANLCPQPNPGIYYDAASQTVCIVGGATNDVVLVNEFGGFFVAYLNAGGTIWVFATDTDLVDHFNVDVRGGDDSVTVGAEVLQTAAMLGGGGDDAIVCGSGSTKAWAATATTR